MEEKRNFNEEPIKGTFPDKKNIICKDCIFRDKSTIEIDGNTIPVGVTKSFCAIYEEPPKTNGKPSEILFREASCEYYQQETYD